MVASWTLTNSQDGPGNVWSPFKANVAHKRCFKWRPYANDSDQDSIADAADAGTRGFVRYRLCDSGRVRPARKPGAPAIGVTHDMVSHRYRPGWCERRWFDRQPRRPDSDGPG